MLTLSFASVELADGLTSTVISLSVNGTHRIQTVEPIGAAFPVFFDRLTKAKSLDVEILQEHSGFARALWTSLIGPEIAGTGVLRLTYTEGAVTHTFECAGARPSFRPQIIGISTNTTHSFDCGEWTYTTTDTSGYAGDYYGGRLLSETPSSAVGGRHLIDVTALAAIGGREL